MRRGGGGVAVSQNSSMLEFDRTHVRCLEMTNSVMINFQTSDSGICSSTQTMNGYYSISPRNMGNSYIEDEHDRDHVTGSGGSARAVIADLKLKLAVKEAEIQKLQATAVARAAAQQKHIAGMLGYYTLNLFLREKRKLRLCLLHFEFEINMALPMKCEREARC